MIKVIYLSSLKCPDNWEESCAFVKQWCLDNKASYYSAPGESFLLHEATDLAIKEGNDVVLVDSLS